MFDTTILGHTAHLVLEDDNGAFEVLGAFQFECEGLVLSLNTQRIRAAIDERELRQPPKQRPVEFKPHV